MLKLEIVQIAEENYLKAIYDITKGKQNVASTNEIAELLKTKASSVTDMIKRLSEKSLVKYEKYKGTKLTESGKKIALNTIRKHRLWEVFLVNELNFGWEEVHEVAEQLEHIQSVKLTNKLDEFLGFPEYDPHGDPIPNGDGEIPTRSEQILLSDVKDEKARQLVGVKDSSKSFLKYLDSQKIKLGTSFVLVESYDYDQSMKVLLDDAIELTISHTVSKNLILN